MHHAAHIIRRALIGAVVAVGLLAQSASASVYQWTLDFPNGVAYNTNTSFSLRNQVEGSFLVYENRGEYNCSGINLGWTDSKTWQWRFRRQGGATGPLLYGERVALLNRKYNDYLHYGERPCGINLEWTGSADYEWTIQGGTNGTRVLHQEGNALFNLTENDDLVYAWRPRGVNLRWMDDAEPWYCQYHDEC